MNTVRLLLLGPVQVEQAGRPVKGFRSEKALALLSYLAVHSGPVSRGRLAGLFWGEKPEAQARGNLRWLLHNLTTLLPGCLLVERQRVTLRGRVGKLPPAEATSQPAADPCLYVDVLAFEELIAKGDIPSLAAAAGLYRGEFMEDFCLDGCPDFELWLLAQREHWRQRASRTLYTLTDHCLRQGDATGTRRFAGRLLEIEPWQEEAHRRMMMALAANGKRSAALTQYETCRRVLAEELGVEPTAETAALYERIRAGEYGSRGAGEQRGRGAYSLASALPAPLTPFVGRAVELAQVAERLANPDCRLLTLTGPGGIGKTRLAIQAASARLADFPQGVFFAPLAAVSAVEALVPAIAEALRFVFRSGQEPKQQLLNYLREKTLLLMLDGFEGLLESAVLLTEILQAAPQVKILVTSRERLDLQAEWLLEVKGLDEESAVQLFGQSAQRMKADFSLARERPAVVRICRLVEGMPLAVELAAAWVRTRSCADIAAAIGRNLDLLAAAWRDAPPRHRSIRAAFDHSWNLLSAAEQTAFRRLSVFRGGFCREQLSVISGQLSADDSTDRCSPLVDKSLLYKTSAGRYEMHELLRQYAAEKLEQAGELAAMQQRHGRYFADYLSTREGDLRGGRQPGALAEIGVEVENVRAGWRWAVEQGDEAEITAFLEGLTLFYEARGWFQEGLETFAWAAEH